MKRVVIITVMLLCCAEFVFAQVSDSTSVVQPPPAPKPASPTETKVYYGGTVGLNFGDYFRIRVAPMVGYKITPKASAGVKVAYEYVEDDRYSETVKSNNYGGSIFARYRFHPRGYAHAEYAAVSYEYAVSGGNSERSWVPFLLVGGAVVQPMSSKASAYVEVLFDVLQDSKSPYKDWEPWVSIGVSVGL